MCTWGKNAMVNLEVQVYENKKCTNATHFEFSVYLHWHLKQLPLHYYYFFLLGVQLQGSTRIA